MTRELAKADDVVRYDLIEAGGSVNVQLLTKMVEKVREVRASVMERGVHYMVIPGTDKDTLTSAGADTLALAFDLLPKYEVLSVHRSDEVIAYVVRCEIYSKSSSRLLGSGMGACNTKEIKYQRQIEKRGATTWELENTIIKMAEKRAKVDAVIGTTAARELFTQDLDGEGPPPRKLDLNKALKKSPAQHYEENRAPPPRRMESEGGYIPKEPEPEWERQDEPADFKHQSDDEIRRTLLKIASCDAVNPTEWETQFMADLCSEKKRRFPLSPKQRATCHKIINNYIDYVYAAPQEPPPEVEEPPY